MVAGHRRMRRGVPRGRLPRRGRSSHGDALGLPVGPFTSPPGRARPSGARGERGAARVPAGRYDRRAMSTAPRVDHSLGRALASASLAALLAVGCTSRHACPAGQVACGESCADLRTDPVSCGACGHSCGLGTCVAGACVCSPGATSCPGSPQCVDEQADARNCGACGAACALAGEVCLAGACACPASLPDVCPSACVDTGTDPRNCGACGNACPLRGEACLAGTCACPAARPDPCAGACVDERSDTGDCGACGVACLANESCVAGACTCPAPLQLCTGTGGTVCTDLATDARNCGMCGVACTGAQVCSIGTCTARCPAGQQACGGACVDLATDPSHCGGCANVCPAATPACAGGRCYALACAGAGCAGGTACCAGPSCPPAHDDGLGQAYFDCAPLGDPALPASYTPAMAQEAAQAWAPAGSAATTCAGCVGWWDAARMSCAAWCYGGPSGYSLPGLVHLDPSGAGCVCPGSATEPGTFLWR